MPTNFLLDSVRILEVAQSKTPQRAVAMAKRFLEKRHPPTQIEEQVVWVALSRIAGVPCRDLPLQPTQDALSFTASSWIRWLTTGHSEDFQIGVLMADREITERSVLDGTTLRLWALACKSLSQGEKKEALRFWKRALEYGGQLGVESYLSVRWSFVATFWGQQPTYTPP